MGVEAAEPGGPEQEIRRGDRAFQVVTIIAKYVHKEVEASQRLDRIMVACIPNGRLQERYNPTIQDTIWLAGRNAPTLGEDFRVRLSYRHLRRKAAWRVEEMAVPPGM